MISDTIHARFRDDIGSYLAGGLGAGERAAFEAHAADCPDCAAALREAMAQEDQLHGLFATAHPGGGLEDRIVAGLRQRAYRQHRGLRIGLHPSVRRAAVSVAAAVMLGGFGYVATQAVQNDALPTPSAMLTRVKTASNLPGIGQGIQMFANENKGTFSRGFIRPGVDSVGGTVLWFESSQPVPDTPAEMARHFAESAVWKDTGATNGRSTSTGEGWTRQYDGIVAANGPAVLSQAPPATATKGAEALDKQTKSLSDVSRKSELAGKDMAKESAPTPGGVPGGFGRNGGGGGFGAAYRYPAPGGGATDQAAREADDKRAPQAAGDALGTVTAGGRPAPAPAGPAPAGKPQATYGLAYAYKPAAESWQMRADSTTPHFNLQAAGPQAGASGEPGALANTGMSVEGRDETKVLFGDEFAKKQEDAKAGEKGGEKATEVRKGEPELARRLTELAGVQAETRAATSAPESPAQPTAGQGAPAPTSAPAPAPPPQQAPSPTAGRKIIRNGEMTFEVDSFDSSFLQITKIAAEEGGFVATTDSEKLANGKVRGVVTVRVPPERLDTLVLKLRGLGELKSSKIAANDITKQYTDLESQLKASRAMEERLLNVIKTGKGEIKDLVEAEKQLGVYREKIEQVEGEIRYYNNLVSLSTLNVTLTERDIRTAALLSETEQVNMGVEADDVEKARAATIKAIEEAKGRIVESDLKKLEAGQFAGRVVADVPPDASGPLIDRLRQVGTVARLEISRKRTAPEGTVAPAQGAALPRVERRDTRFLISLYNLANVAPRQTTSLNLAAEDVEVAYRAILDQVKSAGGRVVTSQLNRPKPDQTTGTITFEVPAEQADVLLGAVRGNGEVMRLEVTQNPDTQNVTQTKRGFAVQVFSMASVSSRETTILRLAARGVPDAFGKLRETVRGMKGARVLSTQLAEQDPANVTGTLDFEVRRDDLAATETALRGAGQVVSRNVIRSADAENTVDTKVRLQVTMLDESSLAPRETVTMQLAVPDVSGQYAKLLEALGAANARVIQSQLNEQEPRNNVTASLTFDVRRETRAGVDKAIKEAGDVVSRNVARSTDTQNTLDDKVRLSLAITDSDRLNPRETTALGLETRDVEKSKEAIESAALALGGRVVDSTLSRETSGRVIGKVVADVPLAKAMEMASKARDQGRVLFRRDNRDDNVPAGSLSRYRVDVTLANEDMIVEGGQGLGSRIREGLRTSAAGLLWSVQLIVVGLFLVAPWVLILWLVWRVVRRGRGKKAGAPGVPATA